MGVSTLDTTQTLLGQPKESKQSEGEWQNNEQDEGEIKKFEKAKGKEDL